MLASGPLRWPVCLCQLHFLSWLKLLVTQLVYKFIFFDNFLLGYTKNAYNQRGFSKRYLHNSQLTKANVDNEAIDNEVFYNGWL